MPLVSAADVGDNVMIDIERYDIDGNYPFFHGRVDNIESINFEELSPDDKKKLIIKLVGFEHNSERMIDSLFSIGGSTVSWPQLGSTASIAGGVEATTIKKIVLNEEVLSGRYFVSLDEILDSTFNDNARVRTRQFLIHEIEESLK